MIFWYYVSLECSSASFTYIGYRVSFFSRLPADRDKSAWFSAEISCEIAVRFRLSCGIYYNNFWKKLCLLMFSWLQTNIMESKAPTIENSVGKDTVFPFRIKKRQNRRTFSLHFLWDSIISCGLNPQIRGENDSLPLPPNSESKACSQSPSWNTQLKKAILSWTLKLSASEYFIT